MLEGAADYAGPASGNYVRKEFDANGDPEHLYHGQFTASATLTASFGGGSVAADDHYSIKGEVENFMDGEEAIDADWKVTLNKAGFDSVSLATDSSVFTGTTSTNDDAMGTNSGNWQGQFFGEVMDNDEDADTPVADVLPSGVAGQFNGHFTNGHVLGAFGAPRKE